MDAKGRKLNAPKGLGRGLSALIPDAEPAPVRPQSPGSSAAPRKPGEEIQYVPLTDIMPNRYQPRTAWNDEKIKELSDSIKESGLLQPLVVRPREGGEKKAQGEPSFELIAGERRLRALRHAGIESAPVIVRNVDSRGSLELAIVENIQREDLNPVDEALGYRRLMQEFQYSQEDLSKKVGKDRTTVANSLRLLNLSEEIQADLAAARLTPGHARALLSLEREADRISLKKLILSKELSVREAERLAREVKERAGKVTRPATAISPEVRFLQESLMAALGTKVNIKHRGRRGKIEIEYYSLSDLERLVETIRAGRAQVANSHKKEVHGN